MIDRGPYHTMQEYYQDIDKVGLAYTMFYDSPVQVGNEIYRQFNNELCEQDLKIFSQTSPDTYFHIKPIHDRDSLYKLSPEKYRAFIRENTLEYHNLHKIDDPQVKETYHKRLEAELDRICRELFEDKIMVIKSFDFIISSKGNVYYTVDFGGHHQSLAQIDDWLLFRLSNNQSDKILRFDLVDSTIFVILLNGGSMILSEFNENYQIIRPAKLPQ